MINHHSASSLTTASQCERKWWYENVERIREPDVEWDAVAGFKFDRARRLWVGPGGATCTSKQRGGARGTALHALLEAYYSGQAVDWSSHIGQIAMSGRAHLPHREACLEIRIEECIGDEPYPAEHDPERTALVFGDVRILGYVDLEVRLDPAGDEAKRLGIVDALRRGGGWYTFDYKTSRDVAEYALDPAEAVVDPQGILYSAAGMIRTDTEARGMRWVYMQTETKSFSKPVDALFTYEGSRVHLTTLVDRAGALQTKTSIDDCLPNTEHCDEYGGCPHHHTRGGPCTAQRPVGRIATMGFKDMYIKSKAEKLAAEKGISFDEAMALINAGETAAPVAAQTPAQTAPTVAPPAKKGFGKKATPAPEAAAPEAPPAGANGPAEVTNVVINVPTDHEKIKQAVSDALRADNLAAAPAITEAAPKKPRAAKASLADQTGVLLDSIKAEFGCNDMGALRVLQAVLDVRADDLNSRP
jgi:hypothetical protein